MVKKILITAFILGIVSIILDAFGAHGLKQLIDTQALQTFETGVRYQMYHALFLLFVGNTTHLSHKTKKSIYYLIIIGVICFSGSIYGLTTNTLTSFDFKLFGFITPLGGLLLIIAWSIALIGFIKNFPKKFD